MKQKEICANSILSKLKNKNILDDTYTGGGKTYRSRQIIEHIVNRGGTVVKITDGYFSCEEDFSNLPSIPKLLFKGKTQSDICSQSAELTRYYKIFGSIHLCDSCQDKEKCKYLQQIDNLNELKYSKRGFVVYSDYRNLAFLLKELGNKRPLIISDDVPMHDLVAPSLERTSWDIGGMGQYLRKNELDSLAELVKLDSPEEIKTFYLKHKEFIKDEMGLLRKLVRESSPKIDLVYLNRLYYILSNGYDFYISKIDNATKLTYFIDFLKKYRFLVLNATRSPLDDQAMDRLGKWEIAEGQNAPVNEKWVIMQISDHSFGVTAAMKSSTLYQIIDDIQRVIGDVLEFIDGRIIVASHGKVYEQKLRGNLSVNHDHIKYRGSDSHSTNSYESDILLLMVGTPILPPEYFHHPLLREFWMTDEPKNGYPVSGDIVDEEATAALIQTQARVLRGNRETRKLCIVISSMDLGEEFSRNTGAIIKKYSISDGKRLNKTRYTVFKKDLKSWVRWLYEVQVIEKVRLKGLRCSEFIAATNGVYSKRFYYEKVQTGSI